MSAMMASLPRSRALCAAPLRASLLPAGARRTAFVHRTAYPRLRMHRFPPVSCNMSPFTYRKSRSNELVATNILTASNLTLDNTAWPPTLPGTPLKDRLQFLARRVLSAPATWRHNISLWATHEVTMPELKDEALRLFESKLVNDIRLKGFHCVSLADLGIKSKSELLQKTSHQQRLLSVFYEIDDSPQTLSVRTATTGLQEGDSITALQVRFRYKVKTIVPDPRISEHMEPQEFLNEIDARFEKLPSSIDPHWTCIELICHPAVLSKK